MPCWLVDSRPKRSYMTTKVGNTYIIYTIMYNTHRLEYYHKNKARTNIMQYIGTVSNNWINYNVTLHILYNN